MRHATLEDNLREMERTREQYWRRYPATSPTKLEWRALTVRHAFHVVPGERVLELGAGSGLWTEHLAEALKGECPITAVVFDPFESSITDTVNGPKKDFRTAFSRRSPSAMSVPPIKMAVWCRSLGPRVNIAPWTRSRTASGVTPP